jgi:hypothetical protein
MPLEVHPAGLVNLFAEESNCRCPWIVNCADVNTNQLMLREQMIACPFKVPDTI